jgi:hypothetical protein
VYEGRREGYLRRMVYGLSSELEEGLKQIQKQIENAERAHDLFCIVWAWGGKDGYEKRGVVKFFLQRVMKKFLPRV